MKQMLLSTSAVVFLHGTTISLISCLTEAKRVHPVLDGTPHSTADIPLGIK